MAQIRHQDEKGDIKNTKGRGRFGCSRTFYTINQQFARVKDIKAFSGVDKNVY